MDHSVSSLSYQGSIVEAITKAKEQKKLLVVYISGDNTESAQLEGSTWTNSTVAESILKYCILLSISEGSKDAANFSAIYPQKTAPCITAVGYNGLQLWQNEGFIDAETLASSLQKAWFSLYIQETIFTATPVNRKPKTQDGDNSTSVSFEHGTSSGMNVSSPSMENRIEVQEDKSLGSFEMKNSTMPDNTDQDHEETAIDMGNTASPVSVSDNILDVCENGLPEFCIERSTDSLNPVKFDENNTGLGDKATEDKRNNVIDDGKINSEVKTETSTVSGDKVTESEEMNVSENLSRSTEVHLNIRLIDGATLQKKFPVTSTLRMVKHYVRENQASISGSFDLAIPYPRKVFNDQELDKTISELGMFGRQTLIVVPVNQATGHHRGESSSHGERSSLDGSDSPNSYSEGYFAYVKRILSYVNPLSYLGGVVGTSNSAQGTQGNVWQFGPNPALQNNLRGTETGSSSNHSAPATSLRSKQAPSSHFGSNIHTLRRDEDDMSRFGDRNPYWNGNSTQYGGGGDNDRK